MTAQTPTELREIDEDTEPSEFGRLPARAKLLDAIFSIAASHDKVCQELDHAAYAYFGIGADPQQSPRYLDDSPLNDLRYAVIQLCATIVEAAIRQVSRFEPFAGQLVDHGLVVELTGDELNAFLRPIFEESGIGHRFEVRHSHEVWKAND